MKQEDVARGGASVIIVLFLMLLLIPLGTLLGGIIGVIVGWVFGDTILHTVGQFGVHDVSMWQLGCFLGFVSAFFRAHTTKKD